MMAPSTAMLHALFERQKLRLNGDKYKIRQNRLPYYDSYQGQQN